MNSINNYINSCKKDDCVNRFTNKCDTCIHTLVMKKDNYVQKQPNWNIPNSCKK